MEPAEPEVQLAAAGSSAVLEELLPEEAQSHSAVQVRTPAGLREDPASEDLAVAVVELPADLLACDDLFRPALREAAVEHREEDPSEDPASSVPLAVVVHIPEDPAEVREAEEVQRIPVGDLAAAGEQHIHPEDREASAALAGAAVHIPGAGPEAAEDQADSLAVHHSGSGLHP